MRRPRTRTSFVVALATAMVLQGCEPSAPREHPSAPQMSFAARDGLHKVASRESRAEGESTAVIGRKGGVLTLGGHRLVVPEGAVDGPTRFRMSLVADGHVEVDLEASTPGAREGANDVGARGFARPVTLELSYREAAEGVDPSRLIVVWVRPDGSLEPQQSFHQPTRSSIGAPLKHFSPYALASN